MQNLSLMPQGDKSKYTDKQKRQAEHIEEGYEKRGVGKKEAEGRAWATVNARDGGGKQSGSGRARKATARKATAKKPTAKKPAAKKRPVQARAASNPTRRRSARKPASASGHPESARPGDDGPQVPVVPPSSAPLDDLVVAEPQESRRDGASTAPLVRPRTPERFEWLTRRVRLMMGSGSLLHKLRALL